VGCASGWPGWLVAFDPWERLLRFRKSSRAIEIVFVGTVAWRRAAKGGDGVGRRGLLAMERLPKVDHVCTTNVRWRMSRRGGVTLQTGVAPALICTALVVNGCMQPSADWRFHPSGMMQQYVTAVAVSDDNEEVAGGTGDGSVYVWSVGTAQLKAQLPPPESPVEYILVGRGAKRRRCAIRGGPVDWVAFAASTNDILAGSGSKLRVLERKTGKLRQIALAHEERVQGTALSRDKRCVAGAAKKHAVLWDARTGERLRAFGPHDPGVSLVSISPANRYLLAGSLGGGVRVWDTASGEAVCTLARESAGHVRSAAWSPGERRFITLSANGRVAVWDLASTKQLLSRDVGRIFWGLPVHGLATCALSPDGMLILLVTPKAVLLDAESGEEVRRLGQDEDEFHVGCFSADGRHVVTGGFGKVTLWETKTGQELRQFSIPAKHRPERSE
jgi:WD40 repeat protein